MFLSHSHLWYGGAHTFTLLPGTVERICEAVSLFKIFFKKLILIFMEHLNVKFNLKNI